MMSFQDLLAERCDELHDSLGSWREQKLPWELLSYVTTILTELLNAIPTVTRDPGAALTAGRDGQVVVRSILLKIAAGCGIEGRIAWEHGRVAAHDLETHGVHLAHKRATDAISSWARAHPKSMGGIDNDDALTLIVNTAAFLANVGTRVSANGPQQDVLSSIDSIVALLREAVIHGAADGAFNPPLNFKALHGETLQENQVY
jgi:hypothetical protein